MRLADRGPSPLNRSRSRGRNKKGARLRPGPPSLFPQAPSGLRQTLLGPAFFNENRVRLHEKPSRLSESPKVFKEQPRGARRSATPDSVRGSSAAICLASATSCSLNARRRPPLCSCSSPQTPSSAHNWRQEWTDGIETPRRSAAVAALSPLRGFGGASGQSAAFESVL